MKMNTNIIRIKAVNNILKQLQQDFVFVGGATVSLYADRATDEPRPTDDVDVLVEVYSHHKYAALEEMLRKIGFINDPSAKFVHLFRKRI